MMISNLWLDQPNALGQVPSRAEGDQALESLGSALIENGIAVLPGLIKDDLCEEVVRDFGRYTASFGDEINKHKDAKGRLLRLVNFHLASEAAMKIGTDARLMKILDFIFGRRAGIYTSLYFEYGSQQPIHRDSPFFETFPRNYFCGVWVALEDIHPDAGPLMYTPAGHRFPCDPKAIYKDVVRAHPGVDEREWVRLSLERYYGKVIDTTALMNPPVTLPLRKGDVAFWHPQAPHGGSAAVNPELTRRSMVFHCMPEDFQVYQHEVFFAHPEGAASPPDRYGFKNAYSRKIALAGETAFQH